MFPGMGPPLPLWATRSSVSHLKDYLPMQKQKKKTPNPGIKIAFPSFDKGIPDLSGTLLLTLTPASWLVAGELLH